MDKFIKIDNNYVNRNKIVKIESNDYGETILFLNTLDVDENKMYTNLKIDQVIKIINDAEEKPVVRKVKKTEKKINKFENIDVDGLF